MNAIQKIDLSNVSALADTFSDEVLAQILAEKQLRKDRVSRIETYRQAVIRLATDSGFSSPEEFLAITGFLSTAPTKGNRTRMNSVKRTAVEAAVKAQIKSPAEIAGEFGITTDSVYSIRSKLGLTVKRKPKATTSAPPSPITVPSQMEVAA